MVRFNYPPPPCLNPDLHIHTDIHYGDCTKRASHWASSCRVLKNHQHSIPVATHIYRHRKNTEVVVLSWSTLPSCQLNFTGRSTKRGHHAANNLLVNSAAAVMRLNQWSTWLIRIVVAIVVIPIAFLPETIPVVSLLFIRISVVWYGYFSAFIRIPDRPVLLFETIAFDFLSSAIFFVTVVFLSVGVRIVRRRRLSLRRDGRPRGGRGGAPVPRLFVVAVWSVGRSHADGPAARRTALALVRTVDITHTDIFTHCAHLTVRRRTEAWFVLCVDIHQKKHNNYWNFKTLSTGPPAGVFSPCWKFKC